MPIWQDLKAHSKGPIETGTIPIRYIIKKRRINYLHHLITRDSSELINKVYLAQRRKSGKNDWVTTVDKDTNEIQLNLSLKAIKSMKKIEFKKYLKKKIHCSAFTYLKKLQ